MLFCWCDEPECIVEDSAPADVLKRELERDRGGGGGKTAALADGSIEAAAVLRERERDRGGGWGMPSGTVAAAWSRRSESVNCAEGINRGCNDELATSSEVAPLPSELSFSSPS